MGSLLLLFREQHSEKLLLLFNKLCVETSRLIDSLDVHLVFLNLLLEHLVIELKLIDTMDEVFSGHEVALAHRGCTSHRHLSPLDIKDDFLQPKDLILAQQKQSENILQRLDCFSTFLFQFEKHGFTPR